MTHTMRTPTKWWLLLGGGSGDGGGARSEKDRISFGEEDYVRLPRVLKVRYSLLLLASAFTHFSFPQIANPVCLWLGSEEQ
jgi:hypothetical protein